MISENAKRTITDEEIIESINGFDETVGLLLAFCETQCVWGDWERGGLSVLT